ncbi:Tic20 family protein [Trichothermofontia sp.]
MTWRSSTTIPERIFACLPYLLPLIEGLAFGQYLFREFPVFQIILIPLLPLLRIYSGIPFAGLIIFFALFFLVVRNERIAHFIRFNTMQAILLDIIVILCSLILSVLGPALQSSSFILETLFNMVFLGLMAAVIYSVAQSLLGRYAEIPTLSDAVHMQVR